jgi:integrase
MLVALIRIGGLRRPSEHFALTWDDIDWERQRLRVHSPKTEHHEGKDGRWAPIFPELRPHLDGAFNREDNSVYIFSDRMRTRFMKIIRRAGLTPWTRVFQNLRSSRESESAATFLLHVVCSWIGNTERVARMHYLKVTDSDFEKAVQKSGAAHCRKPSQF